MTLFLNILFLIIGLGLLIKGADFFVDGASAIAKILKIPTLIIGLTIVALGTSLPELAVSLIAAIDNSVDLSVGNVVGSNIFNTLMVLGLTAVIVPIAIEKKVLKFELPFLLVVTLLLFIFSIIGERELTWYVGLIFLALLVFYIVFLIMRTKKEPIIEEENEKKLPVGKAIIFSIIGVACIITGGEFVNSTAQKIASLCGMEEKLIALTVVALGTSLPELVTSMVAAKKGENDIALGNVIGSNTLNILFILGLSAVIHPLPISNELVFDLIFVLFITIILIAMAILTIKKKGINRICGIIMVVLYVAYLAYIICRNYGILPPIFVF